MQLLLMTIRKGVANNSGNTDEIQEGICTNATTPTPRENDPGAGRDSRGYGRATLLECLERLGVQSNPAVPATLASGERNEGNLSRADPRQVMSPNASQTLPQDARTTSGRYQDQT